MYIFVCKKRHTSLPFSVYPCEWYAGDGQCDGINNNAGCDFDGGDCCLEETNCYNCDGIDCLCNETEQFSCLGIIVIAFLADFQLLCTIIPPLQT